jgi:hypothetical protein
MQKFSRILFQSLFFLTLLFFSQSSQAQGTASFFMQVDYLKVEAGQEKNLEKFLTTYWKPVHKERIKTQEILSWRLYRVQFPSGENAEYNYVIITAFSDFGNVDPLYEELSDIVSRVHKSETLTDLYEKARNLRKLVKSEVFRTVDELNLSFGDKPALFMGMDYMKVGPVQESQYVRLEQEIWKSIHNHRIQQKQMASWALYYLQFPGGTNYPYTYATANYFNTWDELVEGWPEEYWEIVHPGADHENLVNMTHEARELVSSQIWKLVDFAEVSSKK